MPTISIHNPEKGVSFIFLVQLFITKWKLIFITTFFFTLFGYIYYSISNQSKYEAISTMEIGYYKTSPFNFESIENYENVKSFVEANFLHLPKFNNEKVILNSINNLLNIQNRVFIQFNSLGLTQQEAISNLDEIFNKVSLRHLEIMSLKKKNQLKKIEKLNDSLNFYQNEMELRTKQNIADISASFLTIEIDMRYKEEIKKLNEAKEKIQDEIAAYDSFIPTQKYGNYQIKLIHSHNLLVTLFSFFLLGLTISILYVITRYFIRLES